MCMESATFANVSEFAITLKMYLTLDYHLRSQWSET